MESYEALRERVAVACRVLAVTGLVEHILGHVSARTGDQTLLVRGRGPEERGLAFTTVGDVQEVDLDGEGETPPGWSAPSELPIHAEVLRARPEVTAVVHAHPPAVVAASVADLPWLPLVGSYDIPAARLAHDGIPVWPRSALIRHRLLTEGVRADAGHQPRLPHQIAVVRRPRRRVAHGVVERGEHAEELVRGRGDDPGLPVLLLQPQHRPGAVRGRERPFQDQPPLASPQVVGRPVAVGQAEGAVRGDPVVVAQQCHPGDVHAQFRIEPQAGAQNPRRRRQVLLGRAHRIAADLPQRPAAQVRLVLDPAGIGRRNAERAVVGPQFPDRPVGHQGLGLLVLGVAEEGEVLHDDQ
ncbi:class II aldolase/adducin family protein [Streptomyces carpinensis]|uniref:Class II aldolase/adducin family protein n=1 Tax=Streptomyces carpinensis TaxID=66369 RepID=A0ABV1W3R7_9ACTN